VMTSFNQTPFGLLGWGLSWLASAVFFNHSNYYTHSTTVADWGFAHGGRRAFGQPMYRAGNGFNQPHNGFYGGNRPAVGYNRPPVQQAFNHMQPAVNTSRPAYGSNFYGGNSYNRVDSFHGSQPQQAYRAPEMASFQNHSFSNKDFSNKGFSNKGFSGSSFKAPKSSGGGFHPFGGGGGGGHAPKMSGGGHSGGGGHLFGKHHG
jgi:hypothetical protein